MFDEDDLAAIREGHEEWEAETLGPTLSRFGERREPFETDTGSQEIDQIGRASCRERVCLYV